MVFGNKFFFVEVFCLCKQFSFSVGQYFVYMFKYFVVVVWVVVRFQIFFVEINEVMIVYEMDYDIFGFNMDGRVYDFVYCVDDSIVGIFYFFFFNLSKLLVVFSL